ncbi:uncharacterized protein LOC129773069 [Toxorhynchites rutilus septentrionalis]|uniref:uncharacterized protein LOC129773069 n=1 Tax=Toxorhynchites rutilus septentrionalis TaxID=329112 RepID=UPI00247ADEBD|nr:uncharacterized protein LOC129773069 [Toxorhynchites rutilus septentrionalis]
MNSPSAKDEKCLFCGKTENESVDINWVQCHECKRWAHFSCAGQNVNKIDWYCPQCARHDVQKLKVPEPVTKKKPAKKSGSKSDAGSDQGAGSVMDLTEQQSGEEQLLKETFAKQMEARKIQLAMKKALFEQQMKQEREMREIELQFQREVERQQLEFEQKMLDGQLVAERDFLKKRDAIRRKMENSIHRVSVLKEQEGAVGGKIDDAPEDKPKQKVKQWLQQQEQGDSGSTTKDPRGAFPKGGPQRDDRDDRLPVLPKKQEVHDKIEDTENEEGDSDSEDNEKPIKNAREEEDRLGRRVNRISKDQLAARKAVSHSLPKFRGEPEVWPLFISSFEYTTEACGFSNLENLKRLQDCLIGDALEALLKTLLVKVRNAPAPRVDRLESFIHFGITVKQLCDHLETARLHEHLNNPMLVQELVDKLPPSYKLDWVRFKRNKVESPLRMFTNFTNDIVSDVSEVTEFATLSVHEHLQSGKGNPKKKEFVHVHELDQNRNEAFRSAVSKACWICKRSDHLIKFCEEFRRMNIAQRLREVERQKLCRPCLNRHGNGRCFSKIRCTIRNCQGNHHPLLHRVEESVQLQKAECNALKDTECSVIFRQIQVTLYVGNRQFDTVAFLDEGSSATLVDAAVAKLLRAQGAVEPLIVTWTGNINRFENGSRKVELMISAKGSRERFPLFNTRTVLELQLPKQNVRIAEVAKQYQHLAGVPVPDSDWPSEPIAVRSKLGWTIYGLEKRKPSIHTYLNLHSVTTVSNQELHDAIREQYAMEEAAVTLYAMPEPADEKRACEILEATTKRVSDRFETGLIWRRDERKFPDSYPMAVRRMKSLDRKLERNPELKRNVCQQIEDYQVKGYAHKITAAEMRDTSCSAVWYLPMNAVVNPRKPGKVRLVWDAAASVGGVSLNSELLKGPDLLVPLPKVLCCFREGPVAFGGDIQEMFHQMKIRAMDKQALRFLFGTDDSGAPQVYVMDVATFSATCSPCSAQFVKNLNAEQFAEQFPEAAAAITKKHYVDDYYDSADTIEEAIQRAEEVKYIHSRAGFHI